MKANSKRCKTYFLVNPYSGITRAYNRIDLVNEMDCEISIIRDRTLNKVEEIKSNPKVKLKVIKGFFYVFNEKPNITMIRRVMEDYKPDNEQFLEFGDKFLVSQYGRIKVKNKNGRLMFVIQKEKQGLLYFRGYSNGSESKWYSVSRAVAEKFVVNDDPINNDSVIHIDGKRDNNWSPNLRWVTANDTQKYRKTPKTAKPVRKICPVTLEILDDYSSCAEAARNNYLADATVTGCIKKSGYGLAGNWLWELDTEFYKGDQ